MRTRIARAALVVATTCFSSAALAHPGGGDVHGFVHGVMHPFGGLDHVLAMVTVGLFAYQLGGRALWLVPASFVLAMTAGGALGLWGIPVPFVEAGIAASVLVLGAIVALGVKAPVAVAMAVVAAFAVFHGHAHGSEMPLDTSIAPYATGFVLATTLLHAAGVTIGLLIGRFSDAYGRLGFRLSGGLVALVGGAILLHAI